MLVGRGDQFLVVQPDLTGDLGVAPRAVQAQDAERVLLEDDMRAEMRKGLAELRGRLGEGGASGRAAKEVAEVLLESPA